MKKTTLPTLKALYEDVELDDESLDILEVTPPGWEKTVKGMKKHKRITNPWALSWWMKQKGYKPQKEATMEEDMLDPGWAGELNIENEKELEEVSPAGWHGTARAMYTHHPEKFQEPGERKKPGEINPWALVHSMKKKGYEPHYKDQETSLKGRPEKKERYKEASNPNDLSIIFENL